MLLQEIVTLGNIETKDLFKEKICIIKEAYYKNKKKRKEILSILDNASQNAILIFWDVYFVWFVLFF